MILGEKRFTKEDLIRLINISNKLVKVKSDITGKCWVMDKNKYEKSYTLIKPIAKLSVYTEKFNIGNKDESYGLRIFYNSCLPNRSVILNSSSSNLFSYSLGSSMKGAKMVFEKASTSKYIVPYKPKVKIALYLDDTEETVFNLIGKSKMKYFDNICKNLYEFRLERSFVSPPTKFFSFKEYLDNNDFFNMVDNQNGICTIYKLQTTQKNADYRYEVPIDPVDIINLTRKVSSYRMYNITCLRYWYDIDINSIVRDKIIIRDKYGVLFVIAYDKGELEPMSLSDAGFSDSDIEVLHKRMGL